jgi:gamma-glutamyl-gamma-aminobutyrate hydrolase PuuD
VGVRLAAVVSAALLLAGLAFHEPDPGPDAPRVLVAIDRSLWNSLGLNHFTYVRALRRAGLSPVLAEYPVGGDWSPDMLDDGIHGLLLTGGGDVGAGHYGGDPTVTLDVKPARDEFELALLRAASDRGWPILGLCRGAQLMNVWLGGTLGDFRDDPDRFTRHRNAFADHPVTLEPGSELARIYGGTLIDEVTTWHGQHVARPGAGVEIVASASDGTPEAIEVDGPAFAVGVQWHAEMPPWDRRQDALFDAYAEAVRLRQASTK